MKRAWATLTKGDVNAFCEFHAYEQLSNNLLMIFTYEIPMRECSHQLKMIVWVFHLAIKKQNVNR